MLPDVMCSYCLRSRAETGPLVGSPLAAICRPCAQRAVEMFEGHEEDTDLDTPGAPWSRLDDAELIDRLPQVAGAGDQVEKHLRAWVSAARERSISWARIGAALGMTRQSAWERFSDAG